METGIMRKNLLLFVLLNLAFVMASPFSAEAINKFWDADDGNWSVSENWAPTGVPVASDHVWLTQGGVTDITVTLDVSTPLLGHLRVDATWTGTMTFDLNSANTLSVGINEYIGNYGTGYISQSAGTNTVTHGLYLGVISGSSGTYNLSGTGSLSANYEYIGRNGTGTFTQTGGTNNITYNLNLGTNSTGNGTYNLSGTGSLSADNEYIGGNGTGTFNQDAGTNTVTNDLYLGSYSGSSGTYTLSGGTLDVSGNIVDGTGLGILNIDGGTLSVGGGSIDVDIFNVGYNSGANGNYSMGIGNTVSADYATIGYSGTGAFTQTGGTNTVSFNLNIGVNSGSSGTYNLSGTGSLSANYEYIGDSGTGAFTQTGGTNTVTNDLYLGSYSGSSGTYTLSGGTLDISGNIVDGGGTGTLNIDGGVLSVSGGSIDVDIFNVGYNSGSNGNYIMGIGDTVSADYATIGYSGIGAFTQTGGTNTVANTLFLAANAGSLGTYDMQDGTLTAGTVQINSGGTFQQTGGTVNSTLQNQGTFNYNSGTFNGRLLNQGTVNFNADFIAGNGMENQAYINIAADRTVTLNGSGLNNNGGIISLYGTLDGDGPVDNYGTMGIYGGTITGSGAFTNYGLLTANDCDIKLDKTGAKANYGNIDLASGYQMRLTGAALTNSGTLNLNSGIVSGTGSLSNSYGGTIMGRGTIATSFSNSGGVLLVEDGTTNVTQTFTNSGAIQLTSYSANLTGGTLTNTGTIEGHGHVGNNVTNTGVIEALGSTLTLSGTVSNNSGGLITASSGNKLLFANGMAANAGVINLTGGTFDNNNQPMTSTGQISGYGTFRTGGSGLVNDGSMTLTGGTTTVNGNVTNNLNLNVAYNPAIFTDDVTNNGTVKVTDTTTTFAGTYTENGAYISDPATNYFTDIIVGENGYFTGDSGDYWFVNNNFENHSTQNTLWDTDRSYLGFTSGADNSHNFYLAGEDYGAVFSGYDDNFVWGTLSIEGNSLNLFDGNYDFGGSLYVGEILGLEISDGVVTNIFGSDGLNIYYSPSLNEELSGLTYALSDGGQLIGAVPIPSAVWLLGSGLIGIVGIRRKLKK